MARSRYGHDRVNDTAPKSAERQKVRDQNKRASQHPTASWKTGSMKSPKGNVALEGTEEGSPMKLDSYD
jgi:hypothetical protein